ncbi:MAG: response regulator [Anaerolineales bacterium]|nr:response regulator [Anaerolineales bacterium]
MENDRSNKPLTDIHSATAIRLLQESVFEQALQDSLKEIRITTNAVSAVLHLVAEDPSVSHRLGTGGIDSEGIVLNEPEDGHNQLSPYTLVQLMNEVDRSGGVDAIEYCVDTATGTPREVLEAGENSVMMIVPVPVNNTPAGFLLLIFRENNLKPNTAVMEDLKATAVLIGAEAKRDRMLHRLQSRSRSFLRLNTLTRTALEASDLPGLLEILSFELQQMVAADGCLVFLLSSCMPVQFMSDSSTQDKLNPGSHIVYQAALPQNLVDLQTIRVFPGTRLKQREGSFGWEMAASEGATLLALPVSDAKEKYGAVVLQFDHPRKFTIEELTLCDQAVNQTALGMTRTGLLNQLEQQMKKRTKKLADAVEQVKEGNSVRSQAELQMRISEERLSSVTQSAPLGIIMLDKNGAIEFWNPAAERIFGYSSDLITGDSIQKILEEASLSRFWEYIAQKYQLGQELGSDILFLEGISANGKPIPLEVSVGSWEKDAARYYSVLVRDMSREQEIRRWADRQGQFAFMGKLASGVAQDFSTILSAIILYAELLDGSGQLSEKDHNYVEMILQQSKRAAMLSTQILELEHVPSEDQKPLDLIPFMEKVSHLLKRILLDKTEIEVFHGSEDYMISVDENKLRQILLDLSFSVGDSLPEETGLRLSMRRVHVSLESEQADTLDPGEWVLITIQGIFLSADSHHPSGDTELPDSRDDQNNIDLEYMQLVSMVEQQNGILERRISPDGSLCFVLYFPALTISENLEISSESEQRINYTDEQPVVLVVEDEDISRAAVREIFEKQGYLVLEAENGRSALQLIRTQAVDLLVTDVIMPEMGGIALVNQVHKEFGNIEVLIMSGHPLGDGPGELLHSEGVRWLKKPVSTATLSRAAAEALNRRFAVNRFRQDHKD